MKIIHLTDPHIGFQNCAERFNIIAENIIAKIHPANDHVIVITGDLVDDATDPNQYPEAKKIIDKLKESGFPVLICPGNHDYGTGTIHFAKFPILFREVFFSDPHLQFPKLDIIQNTAFIGLDTMRGMMHWWTRWSSQGWITSKQLRQLNKILESAILKSCKHVVIYMHHHPFTFRWRFFLRDAGSLKHVLKRHKIDALLFGHYHFGLAYPNRWGIVRCYDGGSSTSKWNSLFPHRMIDLDLPIEKDYDGKYLE